MKSTDSPIIVAQTYQATREQVWKAITEPEQMRQWFFQAIPDFKPEVGFETEFEVQAESRSFPHQWRVTEVEPLHKLVYNWRYEGYSGDSYVVFELFEKGLQTQLRLTAVTTADFPEDIPEFRRESCIGGWEYFIQEGLYDYLQKHALKFIPVKL
ncbi:SRPBCC family protein [Pontibacter sp. CAU 1760]